jgi:hypothetical protein
VGAFILVFENIFAGIVIIVLGLFLYRLLYRFSAKVERELGEAENDSV